MTESGTECTWFGPATEPLLGWWELPAAGGARGAVVLCPSLAQEHTSAYRSMRFLAERLAAAGFAALRFDYAGTGDSAGTGEEPDRVERWRSSIATAVAHARSVVPAPVAVVGLRVGATLLAEAYATCAPPDAPSLGALVLWDPCVSGKTWLRRQAALHRLTSAAFADETAPAPAGSVEIAGMTFDPASAAAFGASSLDGFGWRDKADVPVLVLARAGTDDGSALLPDVGGLDRRSVTGQEDMVDVEPVKAQVPAETLQVITDWLSDTLPAARVPVCARFAESATLLVDGVEVRERVGRFGPRQVAGVVTEPAQPSASGTVVFLGASDHRVGPARLWVTWSRSLAARGVRCARIDVGGTGDSQRRPDEMDLHYYTPDAVADTVTTVRALVTDPRDAALAGLCAGAWTAMRAADELECRSAYLISQLVWTREPIRIRPSTEPAEAAAYDDDRWHRIRGRVRAALPRTLTMLLDEVGATNGPVARLAELSRRGVDATVVLGSDESDAFDKLVGPHLHRQLAPSPFARRVLRRRGRPGVLRADGMDHAMLTRQGRERGTTLLTALIEAQNQDRAAR